MNGRDDKELATQLRNNMQSACDAANELNRRGWSITMDFKFKTNDTRIPYLYIRKEIEL